MTILLNEQIAKYRCHLDSNKIQVEAATVREALVKLGEIAPWYSKVIVHGKVSRLLWCQLNGVFIDELDGLDTPLKESDVLVVQTYVPDEITSERA